MLIPCHPQRGHAGQIAFAVVLCLVSADVFADDGPGCTAAFRTGSTATFSGSTVAGEKNPAGGAVELSVTAGAKAADAVSIAATSLDALLLNGGSVTYRADPNARWGNLCLDAVAPDGRRWSFLALNWQDENAHPNVHGVIDWANQPAGLVGFIDTASGAYHEAQIILEPSKSVAGRSANPGPDTQPGTGRSALCDVLFKGDEGHIFVGKGYATKKGASPGHLALRLHATERTETTVKLRGHFIATDGPRGPEEHAFLPDHSACIDLPDKRYSMLQLTAEGGAEMVLWLWGENNVPQKNDRLMGYVTFEGSAIKRSKIALWRF